MSTHTVHATITVELTNTDEADERAKVEAAVKAGLKELPSVAKRYGYRIVASDASVD